MNTLKTSSATFLESAQHTEAQRLLTKGFKLCALHKDSKRPVGNGWNLSPVTAIDPEAGGYGAMLESNGLCSVDPDNVELARVGLHRCGFDLEEVMAAGVRTSSTRPGSGGRSTFKALEGVGRLVFSGKKLGTVLELRAGQPNLQDCLPGTVYKSKDGSETYRQDYANGRTLDDATDLPLEFAAWWRRLWTEPDYLHEQQQLLLGPDAMLSVSTGDGTLAFASTLRGSFNDTHNVVEIIERHNYTQSGRGRWSPPTATGAPAVRPIPGKDGLWRSDHASDPLCGTFDAWNAVVVLDHGGDLASAEAAYRPEHMAMQVADFPDMAPVPGGAPPLPSFERTAAGAITKTKNNVVKALERSDVCGVRVRHDAFRFETMLAEQGTEGWRPLKDTDYTVACIRLEQGGFQNIPKDLMRDAVALVAERNTFDSAQHWLGGLQWDGQARIERFLMDYLQAEDTPYTRAVSLYLWTALAGRVMVPGIKCDMVPVIVGPQGARKSTAVASLVPDDQFFSTLDLAADDDKQARIMRGKLVVELDELKGLNSRDAEHFKSLITRRFEEYVPKYMEMVVRYMRRSVFIGTSNRDDFLGDETGNRRWLPFRCGVCDTDAIVRDRDQLWAEARERFKADGVLYREAERLAEAEHAAYLEHDEWDDAIRAWLHRPDSFDNRTPYGREYLTAGEVLLGALNLPSAQHNKMHTSRVKKSLIRQGYTYANKRVDGVKTRGFEPPCLF